MTLEELQQLATKDSFANDEEKNAAIALSKEDYDAAKLLFKNKIVLSILIDDINKILAAHTQQTELFSNLSCLLCPQSKPGTIEVTLQNFVTKFGKDFSLHSFVDYIAILKQSNISDTDAIFQELSRLDYIRTLGGRTPNISIPAESELIRNSSVLSTKTSPLMYHGAFASKKTEHGNAVSGHQLSTSAPAATGLAARMRQQREEDDANHPNRGRSGTIVAPPQPGKS